MNMLLTTLAQSLRRGTSCLVVISMALVATLFAEPLPTRAATGTPQGFSFQGRLSDTSGVLLGGSSGTTYCFRFSIWSNATSGTGSRFWPSSTPSAVQLPVTNGLFAVNVGIDTADVLDLNFNSNDSVYLQVEVATYVSSSCGTFETFTPRKRIVAVPYALNADKLDGLDSGTGADAILKLDSSGNIGLTATNPAVSSNGSNTLTLQAGSTGDLQFFSSSNKLTNSGALTIASTLSAAAVTATATSGAQLTARYDGGNYLAATVSSTGVATLTAAGSAASVVVASPFSVTGGQTSLSADAATVPLKVRGAASQSANLLEVVDNSNVTLASISSTGEATFPSIVTTQIYPGGSNDLTISVSGVGKVKLGSGGNFITVDSGGRLAASGSASLANMPETFLNVAATSNTAVRGATACGGSATYTTGNTNPDVPRNITVTESGGSTNTGNVVISGVLADGTSSTETIAMTDEGTSVGSKAFATISSIAFPGCTGTPNISIGTGTKLGLSNSLHGQDTVYKATLNSSDITIPTVNTSNSTVDVGSITTGDDFTFWYRF